MDKLGHERNQELNFRTVGDLNATIIKGLTNVPRDIDLIVGIPRSGLLAATLLATYLELPLTDVEGFIHNRLLSTGRTRSSNVNFEWNADIRVLVVDDSVNTGETLRTTREKLRLSGKNILFCGIYVTPSARRLVDLYFEVCTQPRFFQWNIMHHGFLSEVCMDIDGVICRDPLPDENDDGAHYKLFLSNVEPLFVPRQRVKYLVTNRLEKYRADTVAWLSKYGVKYDHLIMMDLATMEDRLRVGNHAAQKAKVYLKSETNLFIESSLNQAKAIASISGKPVLCIENWSLITPDYQLRHLKFHLRNLYHKYGYKLPLLTSVWRLINFRRYRQLTGRSNGV